MDHDVVIAGGGPTGLMLAAELKLAGVDAVVVERRPDQSLDGSRAGGLLPRTIEVFDQRGVAQRFVDAGVVHTTYGFGGTFFDVGDLPSRHSYVLALPQAQFEPMLADWVIGELGASIRRSTEVVDVVQHDDAVDVALSTGETLRAGYLVGCDGGRSAVRKRAGIEFVGEDATTSWMIAECRMAQPPDTGFFHNEFGTHAINVAPDGVVRVVLTERDTAAERAPHLEDLRALLIAICGTDYGLHDAAWVSRFSDATRQAAFYRNGRVFVAGDAAHVHPPQGGQGMGTGIQDAVNLGWKLGHVVHGVVGHELLDTYHVERHPVAARVLQNTQAQALLGRTDVRHVSLKNIFGELTSVREVRHRLFAMLAALDLCYVANGTHPLLGRRMPDVDLITQDGATRAYELLHDARPVLLRFDASATTDFDPTPWHRLKVLDATRPGPMTLPLLGEVPVPRAVLIRPDGYVGWCE